MTPPPDRHKPREAWDVGEIVRFQQSGEEPVSEEFADYVRQTAEQAGLDPADFAGLPEPPADERDFERMSVDDIFRRIRRR